MLILLFVGCSLDTSGLGPQDQGLGSSDASVSDSEARDTATEDLPSGPDGARDAGTEDSPASDSPMPCVLTADELRPGQMILVPACGSSCSEPTFRLVQARWGPIRVTVTRGRAYPVSYDTCRATGPCSSVLDLAEGEFAALERDDGTCGSVMISTE